MSEKKTPGADDSVGTVQNNASSEAPEKASVNSRDLDDAYELYKRQDATEIDPNDAKRVLRKIDIHILPLLMMTYMLQFLDKSSINFASVYGLRQGTNLHGQDYAWLGSIFYFGYLFSQYPAGYLLQRLPIGKFIGGTTMGESTLLPILTVCEPDLL